MKPKMIPGLVIVGCIAGTAHAQVKVGVITSSSGPVASIGIAQKNSIALLPREVAGQKIDYVGLDDASDPTATVSSVRKLIDDLKVDAIIGPSASPNAMNVIQIVADAKIVLLAPVGSAAVVLPMTDQKRWVFKTTPNDDLYARKIVDHMSGAGVKTLGFIGSADAYGENWLKVLRTFTDPAGIKVVATESFQRSDTSTTAQGLKVLMVKPDAVLIAAPGSAAVLPETTLVDQGYKGQIYQTGGAAFDGFLKLGGKKVEGAIVASTSFTVDEALPKGNPSKPIIRGYIEGYKNRYGYKPSMFGTNVFDAGLILQAAIPQALLKGKPGTPEFRAALRDAVERTSGVVGAQGSYTMSASDHSGMSRTSIFLLTVKNGNWVLLK